MTLCTFNVNSIRARLDLLLRWLDEKRPVDVLCLQEIKCETDAFPYEAFETRGYRCAVHGQKGRHGVAICAKTPLASVKTHFDHDALDHESRLIEATIGQITVLCCYLPHGDVTGDKHAFKLAFFDALQSYAARKLTTTTHLILAGDLNVARTPLDLYDPAVFEGRTGFLPDERAKMEALLQTGLRDCFREHHPDSPGFTWWDYRTAGIWRNEGMRIDYILASEPLCPAITEIEVDLWTRKRRSPTPSDHAPVVARIEVPA
jgi:exodeoxyribonuclease-3